MKHVQGNTLIPIIHIPWAPKPTCLEDFMSFMVNNLVFKWPKTLNFHGFGGSWCLLEGSSQDEVSR